MVSLEENEPNKIPQVPKTSSDSLTSLDPSPDPQKTGLLFRNQNAFTEEILKTGKPSTF